MIKNFNEYIEPFVSLDKPVEYKGLKLYPIKVNEIYEFYDYISVLSIDKNSLRDNNGMPSIEVIQMKYLSFLFKVLFIDIECGDIWLNKFLNLFNMILKCNNKIEFEIFDNKPFLYINDIKINADEFDDIKNIIFYTNIEDYNDKYIDPDVKKAMEEYSKFTNKGILAPTLEEKISIVCSELGVLKKDILNITYREFCVLFNTCRLKVDYITLGRKVENVEHWIYRKPYDPYSKVFNNDNSALSNMIDKSEIIK